MHTDVQKSKGILNPKEGEKKFQIARYLPSQDLSFFVQRYWIIRWDLRGQAPYLQEKLSYPCVNLVIQREQSCIYGVEANKSGYLLEGQGVVFGMKFRPGAFYPFLKAPVSTLTDKSILLEDVFDVETPALEDAILSQADDAGMLAVAEQFLRAHLPQRDDTINEINRIVDTIIADRQITKVDNVVKRLHINKRTLQRLFNQYVGVSPKWVIKQYRLHDAADQLAEGITGDCSKMALDLGYFDQAHFIKDFKMVVGQTPTAYAKIALSN